MSQVVTGFVEGQKYEIEYPEDMEQKQIIRATSAFFESLPITGVKGSPADLFEQAANYALENEGGDSDDKDDRGGKTRFGISQRAFPDLDISSLTLQDAKDIYRKEFWERPGFDQLPYDTLAVKVFDAGINMGTKAAGKLLQRALNDTVPIGAEEAELKKIKVDGRIGPNTLGEITARDQEELMAAYVKRLRKRYGDIVRRRPKNSKFLRGWMKRAERLPNAEEK